MSWRLDGRVCGQQVELSDLFDWSQGLHRISETKARSLGAKWIQSKQKGQRKDFPIYPTHSRLSYLTCQEELTHSS